MDGWFRSSLTAPPNEGLSAVAGPHPRHHPVQIPGRISGTTREMAEPALPSQGSRARAALHHSAPGPANRHTPNRQQKQRECERKDPPHLSGYLDSSAAEVRPRCPRRAHWPHRSQCAVPRNHGDVTSPWLIRAAGAAWRGNREYCGTPGAWGAEPRGQALAGLRVSASSRTAEPGAVLILGLAIGPLRLNVPCRVVYVVNESRRRGFAYGALTGRPESGEESFMIEHFRAARCALKAGGRPR